MQNKVNQLIKKCKRGNQVAQMQIYDSYCNAMYNVALRYLKNEEDAKDVMQEGFLKAFLNIEYYEETATFGSWLKRIIINKCIDMIRKHQFDTKSLENENLHIVDDNDWQFESSITKEQIVKTIKQLPEKYRLVITLYLIEGYDHEEISQILDIAIKTSRTQLRRAKLQLQEQLKTQYNEARY
ncbi:RNA polymerase subunit sigma-70 [Winogradskyella sp. PC-19]|jgi:RNA polymerase sigma-70 factor (ECF subfamily)|uniref:RNA polymerase sigma factor n=1 Tax=unclassified Winogradskyella TaxID=2615021 RepID=UPI000B3BFE1A|nr:MULTISPECIES: RNA polymerase sigma factor [unclassified Winogradskyella]ARV10453.1 RNA polymerase subunit sigma-70 [Winogradskyella sp. PC-19]